MLKKNHKLLRSDFTTVFEKRKVFSSSHFTLRALKVASWDEFGVSVVVSKKVEGKAVDRNKAKRRTYYALKVLSEDFKSPFRGVFVMRKSVAQMDFYDLQTELQELVDGATRIA
jgi:ribonuclease P protein component